MIVNGTRPVPKDHRDYSFNRTFGTLLFFPESFNTDAGLTMPNQSEENHLFNPTIPALEYGCTGYTQAELCGDQDKTIYNPRYTYDKTLFMEGHQEGVGCDIRNSLKSTIIYGVQRIDENGEEQAIKHHRGQYFSVGPTTDWFDGMRNALWQNNRSISVGTPWFSQWENTDNGIIREIDYSVYTHRSAFGSLLEKYLGRWFGWCTRFGGVNLTIELPWHNHKLCGWETINGEIYLKSKSWQGKEYGKGGYCYFSRKTFNTIMEINGCRAFTLAKADPANIETVKHTVLEFLLSYLRNVVGLSI